MYARAVPQSVLARKLTLFDAVMIVMGGIVGAGIFMNPAVVAQEVSSASAILGAWLIGGAVALAGAFIYAELASRRPAVGGQYAYLREAFHPLVAFLYGWTLLLVVQSGGMAAVAMTFARYFRELSGSPCSDGVIAATTLLALTAVNCFGVRAGSNLQSAFMVLKIGAVAMLVALGWWALPVAMPAARLARMPRPASARSEGPWCRYCSRMEAGRRRASSLASCASPGATCREACSSASWVSSCSISP